MLKSHNEIVHPQVGRVRKYLTKRYSCFETIDPETAIDEVIEFEGENEFQRWRIKVRNILKRQKMPRYIERKEFIDLCMSLMLVTGQLSD